MKNNFESEWYQNESDVEEESDDMLKDLLGDMKRDEMKEMR